MTVLPVVKLSVKQRHQSQSFSLIEVIIFIGILSLFFVTGMVVVTASLRNMKVSEHKIVASQYVKQLMSWITVQKENDWVSFVDNYTSASPGKTYCFNDETIAWPVPNIASPCADFSLGSPAIFRREATLTSSGTPTSQVEINITIEWNDAGNTFSVPLNTVLSRWE